MTAVKEISMLICGTDKKAQHVPLETSPRWSTSTLIEDANQNVTPPYSITAVVFTGRGPCSSACLMVKYIT